MKYEAKLNIFCATIDTDFVDNVIKEAEPFIKLAILPELVGKWFSRRPVAANIDSTQTASTITDNMPQALILHRTPL